MNWISNYNLVDFFSKGNQMNTNEEEKSDNTEKAEKGLFKRTIYYTIKNI